MNNNTAKCNLRRAALILALVSVPGLSQARDRLVEPTLHAAPSQGAPTIYLTFDACMNGSDPRILKVLVEEAIPATIFATARWIRRNPETMRVLLSRPDLFEIENHGENHVPAIDRPLRVYGIAAAGSPEAVAREVEGGLAAIAGSGAPRPHWFRGATAKYTISAMQEIEAMGLRIAGYSINGDAGATAGALAAERRILAARDGDVILAHINQPTHPAGAGVARALVMLKKRGFVFRRLEDMTGGPSPKVARDTSGRRKT